MAAVACAIQRQPLAHFTDVLPDARASRLLYLPLLENCKLIFRMIRYAQAYVDECAEAYEAKHSECRLKSGKAAISRDSEDIKN
jgi:hypothetical protein